MAHLRFPLNDRDYYEGRVNFQVYKEIPPEIGFSSRQVEDAANTEIAGGERLEDTLTGYIERSEVTVSKTRYEYGQRVSLFLPQAIQFQDGVQFDEFSLGRIGAGAEKILKSGGGFASALGSAGASVLSTFTDIVNSSLTPDAARLAATRISKIGPEAAGAVSSALQTTTNPNKRVLFREVNIREFSFNFRLIPVSPAEAEISKQLVRFFRTELYPRDSVVIAGVPIGYRFPNKFMINFKHRTRDVAHRLKPAYLVSMQTVYNPNSMGFFEDGNFTEIEITMNFREATTLSRKDIERGF